jgi:hemoglobin
MSTPRATSSARLTGLPDLDSREHIAQLVRDFYRDVAMDDLLGPIFSAAHVDWAAHLAKLTDFWAKQLLGDPGYEGNPLRAHAPLHAATPFRSEHYRRWLDLFTTTVDEHFAGPYADLAKHRAERMARALERLLAGTGAPGSAPIEVAFTAGRKERMDGTDETDARTRHGSHH